MAGIVTGAAHLPSTAAALIEQVEAAVPALTRWSMQIQLTAGLPLMASHVAGATFVTALGVGLYRAASLLTAYRLDKREVRLRGSAMSSQRAPFQIFHAMAEDCVALEGFSKVGFRAKNILDYPHWAVFRQRVPLVVRSTAEQMERVFLGLVEEKVGMQVHEIVRFQEALAERGNRIVLGGQVQIKGLGPVASAGFDPCGYGVRMGPLEWMHVYATAIDAEGRPEGLVLQMLRSEPHGGSDEAWSPCVGVPRGGHLVMQFEATSQEDA